MYTNKTHLYWCVNKSEEAVYQSELEEISKSNPNFNFTIWSSSDNGYLTADKLALNNYNKGFLICGPSSLKNNLHSQLLEKGVLEKNIYDEEFAFR